MRTGRAVLALVVAAVVFGVGIRALSTATMSRHEPVPRNSRIELVLDASTKQGSTRQTLTEMVSAQILTCRLQVSSDLVGSVEPLTPVGAHGRYRAVLTPSLDHTDRRQFRGCLQDWTTDHVRMRVITLEQL